MTAAIPRPALRKAPDAHVHPADPTRTTGAPPPRAMPAAVAPSAQPAAVPLPRLHRLSGPPRGATSDTLRTKKGGRAQERRARAAAKQAKEKKVELTVKVPKSLRKDLRAAAKASGRTPDEVITSLIRAWIDN